jgi:hypothetical protein
MITLISTPKYIEQVSPEIVSRWVATESPNNFRLLRHDWDIVSAAPYGSGLLQITVAAGTYTGQLGNVITVFNQSLNAMYVGEVMVGSDTTTINTDIPFITGFNPGDSVLVTDRDFTYFNDNTLFAGYYFEGRLTINGVLNNLSIIASPDSYGYADLDVSGILRIVTSLGKIGDYTELIMAETNKSGNFYLEYRDCWYGNTSNSWTIAEVSGSPPAYPLWYYAEAVRSVEQGSNLHEYEADDVNCAPFFNSFEHPVYFVGLPFDISFILPERYSVSPSIDVTVTLKYYNSQNVLLSSLITNIPVDDLDGHVCSLTIDPASVPDTSSYLTAEITAP